MIIGIKIKHISYFHMSRFLFFLLIFFGVQAHAEESLEFMYSGYHGYSGVQMFNPKFENCVLEYNQSLMGSKIIFKDDFNNVRWKSSSFDYTTSTPIFKANCKGKCRTWKISPVNKSLEQLLNSNLSNYEMAFPFFTSEARFNKALRDFQSVCPGVYSKY